MDGQEIPGHYFDKEKKKYFKILPSHNAPPNYAYTREKIAKREQEEEARQVDLAYRTAVETQLVRRSKILSSTAASGLCSTRETAEEIRPLRYADEAAQTYASGFEEAWRIAVGHDIKVFVADPETDSYLIGHGQHQWQEFGATYISMQGKKRRAAYRSISIFRHNDISSISLSPSRVAMTTTLGGSEPAHIIISPLRDRCFGLPPISRFQVTYRRNDETDVWASAANPWVHNVSFFAAALSNQMVAYLEGEGGQWYSYTHLRTQSNALAVEWLQPSVIATGLRCGLMHLTDLRSRGSALRLQHPSSITGIKRVTPETLVICGLQNTLAMYDLRMPIVENIGTSQALSLPTQKKPAQQTPGKAYSQPVVQYEIQTATVGVGFDVSRDSGIVAAVDADNLIQLYSLQSGHKVKALKVERPPTMAQVPTRPVMTQLQFTSTGSEDGYSREQLVASCGPDLVGFQW